MSTKPCPQCGSSVPLQARFCGQCGNTFAAIADGGARGVPKTVDEATADPPPAAPTALASKATMLGYAVVPTATTAPDLGKTLFDPAPYGRSEQPPTREVPPKAEPAEREASASNPAHGAGLGKTLVLGGATAADFLPKTTSDLAYTAARGAKTVDAPSNRGEMPAGTRPTAQPMGASPLSMSVLAPGQPTQISALAGTIAADTVGVAPPAKPAFNDKQTMLGMPAVGLATPARDPQAFPSASKTMMGVALPGIAPTTEKPREPPPRAGTMMGIASPGIAPLQAGRASVQAASPPPQPIVPAPAPLVEEPLPDAPRIQAKRGVPAIAVVLVIFVFVALVGGGAAVLFLRPSAPLTARPQLDETGKESLKIGCESCPDGTVITLGAASTKVQGAAALLPLPAPLSIGDNDLEMAIDRPGTGRDETVKVHVPVAYRVKADVSTLTSVPPSITVRVEALPNTDVTVDGKPMPLDASGKASVPIDLAAEVEGKSDDQKAIDKKISFTIKSKGAAPENGQLVVRAAVVPLHMDAPGIELYTSQPTAAISGQTKPGGTLTVDGKAVTLDAQGRFGVRVELPAEGEKPLTIVAHAPPLAPRIVHAKVVRVASLDAAAKTLEAKEPLSFDAFSADPTSKLGNLVVVEGEILETRVAQGHTVLLMEEKKACGTAGACIVRVVHGEEVKAVRGDNVRVFGRLAGTVSSGGKTVPDVEGGLALVRPGAKK